MHKRTQEVTKNIMERRASPIIKIKRKLAAIAFPNIAMQFPAIQKCFVLNLHLLSRSAMYSIKCVS